MNGNSPIFGTPEGRAAEAKRDESRRLKNIERMLVTLTQTEDAAKGNAPVTVGDRVLYRMTDADIKRLNRPNWNGNVQAGDVMPAVVTRTFDRYSLANLTVFLDNGVGSGVVQMFSVSFIGRIEH